MPEDIQAWFASRIPKSWFTAAPEVIADSEEILVVGPLPDVELSAGTSEEGREAARGARIARFREETREDRVKIAREAERHFRRKRDHVSNQHQHRCQAKRHPIHPDEERPFGFRSDRQVRGILCSLPCLRRS